MKPQKLIPTFTAALLAGALSTYAADITWTGAVDTNYQTAGNWSSNTVPVTTGADNAIIGGEVEYNPGGDYQLSTGSSLTINSGGSWTQITGPAYIVVNGGTLNLNGGSFSTGSSTGFVIGENGGTFNVSGTLNMGSLGLNLNANSTLNYDEGGNIIGTFNQGAGNVNILGGTLNTSGNYTINSADAAFSMTGGNFTLDGEFKPLAGTSTISGGTLTANLISFDGTDSTLNLAGGQIHILNNAFQGIYAGGDAYINFTTVSGSLLIDGLDENGANTLLASGRLRYNGVNENIIATATGTGYSFSAVPEPSSFALLGGALALGFTMARRRRA